MEERNWQGEAAEKLPKLGYEMQSDHLYASKLVNVSLDYNHGYIPTICPKGKIPLNDEHVAIKMVDQIYDEIEKVELALRFKGCCGVKLDSSSSSGITDIDGLYAIVSYNADPMTREQAHDAIHAIFKSQDKMKDMEEALRDAGFYHGYSCDFLGNKKLSYDLECCNLPNPVLKLIFYPKLLKFVIRPTEHIWHCNNVTPEEANGVRNTILRCFDVIQSTAQKLNCNFPETTIFGIKEYESGKNGKYLSGYRFTSEAGLSMDSIVNLEREELISNETGNESTDEDKFLIHTYSTEIKLTRQEALEIYEFLKPKLVMKNDLGDWIFRCNHSMYANLMSKYGIDAGSEYESYTNTSDPFACSFTIGNESQDGFMFDFRILKTLGIDSIVREKFGGKSYIGSIDALSNYIIDDDEGKRTVDEVLSCTTDFDDGYFNTVTCLQITSWLMEATPEINKNYAVLYSCDGYSVWEDLVKFIKEG